MHINFNLNPEEKAANAIRKEWLETNGLGGYASSTLLNCNTRKYHGLLVLPLNKRSDKYVLLSTLEESVVSSGQEFFISTHQYPDALHPQGYGALSSFSPLPAATFTYRAGDVVLQKEILMPQGENAVMLRYSLPEGTGAVELKVKPFLSYRNFHELARQNPFIRDTVESSDNGLLFRPYDDMPPLHTALFREFDFAFAPDWYHSFEYAQERERGFDSREDLYTPGTLSLPLRGKQEVILCFAAERIKEPLDIKWRKEISRRTNLNGREDAFQSVLKRSAGQFLVSHASGNKNIVAGYHWFLEWGRDAMIALPGLTLCTGRPDDCLEVLKTFARYEKNGLIPNFINETTGDAAYNTVDASLWFGWATQKYLESTKNFINVKKLIWPALKNVFLGYLNGTDFSIKMDENGLVRAGDENTQLTWMDAMVSGRPVTPRYGYAVEINALWYNFVNFMGNLAYIFEDNLPVPRSLTENIKKNFISTFWLEEKGYLGDTHSNGRLDASIRPNQVFAVSLPYSMLSIERSRRIMETLTRELFTPVGLRTLAPSDPRYRGRYAGDSASRDSAYHNGTVWPWLLGHYFEALAKTAKDRSVVQEAFKSVHDAFADHLREGGVGTVSEVFDGDSPHCPGGCIAQAWSVAELLRIVSIMHPNN